VRIHFHPTSEQTDCVIQIFLVALQVEQISTLLGNRPLEPKAREVEFFPKEEVLHEEVKIH
jgi:hypothetical protein